MIFTDNNNTSLCGNLFESIIVLYIEYYHIYVRTWGAIVVVIVWLLDLQLPVQSMPITTEAVSSNPVHGEVYSIQNYVIKFVSDLQQVNGFL
jgi:hypothetical protein